MTKFRENELNKMLEDFRDENIELEFEKGIDGKVKLEKATLEYDYKTGFINITATNGELHVNTTMACGYERIENQIMIDLETILLKIKK